MATKAATQVQQHPKVLSKTKHLKTRSEVELPKSKVAQEPLPKSIFSPAPEQTKPKQA